LCAFKGFGIAPALQICLLGLIFSRQKMEFLSVDETVQPRGWRRLPTAWVHLFLVELLHIYLAILSWRSLINTVNSKCSMLKHHIGTARIQQYYSDLYFFGHADAVHLDFNKGKPLVLPEQSIWDHAINVPWFIIGWTLPLGACALLLYIVARFASASIWSFEEAKYLNFTWLLPRQRPYQYCIAFMASGPVLLPIVWFIQVIIWTDGREEVNQLTVMKSCTLSGVMLLFSLDLLAFPTAPSHDWHSSPEFLKLTFRRSLVSLFLGRNNSFGLKLMDALWTAQHGDSSRLKRYVPNPGMVSKVLQICTRAQEREAKDKEFFRRLDSDSASEEP